MNIGALLVITGVCISAAALLYIYNETVTHTTETPQ